MYLILVKCKERAKLFALSTYLDRLLQRAKHLVVAVKIVVVK